MKVEKDSLSDSENEVRDVLDGIRKIVRALRIASRQTEQNTGLTSAQLFVLTKLADGNAVSINDVAARTLTHQSSVSVVVQRLAARGLIERVKSKDDSRKVYVVLTNAGRKALASSPDIVQERLIASLNAMQAPKRKLLAGLLNEFIDGAGFSGEPATLFFENDKTTMIKKTKSKTE